MLKHHKNVLLAYGDSRKLIPKHVTKDSIILIDGPKGEPALILAANLLLKHSKVKAVFIHDLTKKDFRKRNSKKHISKHLFC